MGQVATEVEDDWDLVARLAADLHDAHGRLVDLMVGVITEGTWEGHGLRSPEHFLVLRAGLSQGQARAIVLLARRACELPETAKALREGRISLDQAAVVARHTPAEFDTTVAEFAQHATVPQLQRSVAKYDFQPLKPAEDSEESRSIQPTGPEPDAPASLTMHHADGRFTLRYDAPSELGALVETALAEAKDWLFQQRSGTTNADPATQALGDGTPIAATTDRVRVTWADALTVLASRSLDSVEVTGRRSKYRINVFLDVDGGWLSGKPRLPRHVLEGLTCDGQLVPVWTTEGVPVNVGRSHRVVPERTRRLVADRDRGCRFPGCAASAFVEVHHLVHWADGGLTDLDNLLSLCPFHHDAHHRQEFTISGDPTRDDGLVFRSARGLLLDPAADARPPSRSAWSQPPQATGWPPLALVPDTPPDGPEEEGRGDAVRGGLRVVTEGETSENVAVVDDAGVHDPASGGIRARPAPRTDRTYAAPAGHPLHVALVNFTPYPPPDAWRQRRR